jgi:dimeric dUTPase (all-alpha-NTP-PPase superfamily)
LPPARGKEGVETDKLDEIFRLQGKFDADLARSRGLSFSFEEWMQKEAMAMTAEIGELLEEVNFKWWKNPRPIDLARIREELVDILHFLVAACIRAGLDAESLYREYVKKNSENFRRQDGRSERREYCAPTGSSLRGDPEE